MSKMFPKESPGSGAEQFEIRAEAITLVVENVPNPAELNRRREFANCPGKLRSKAKKPQVSSEPPKKCFAMTGTGERLASATIV
jgi:hypothetical protein